MAVDDGSDAKIIEEIPYEDASPEGTIVRASINYWLEAKYAKRERMELNKINFDTFHLKQDFSHKKTGQSKEFLAKQAMAVEQISSFVQQSLIDSGDWMKMQSEPGVENPLIKPEEMTLLTLRQLDKAHFNATIVDLLKLALLGGVMVAKVHGKYVTKPRYYTQDVLENGQYKKALYLNRDKKIWQLEVSCIRQEDYYPDPTGRKLYEMQDMEMDFHDVVEGSKGPDAMFDPKVIEMLRGDFADYEQVAKKSRETAQNLTQTSYRRRVQIQEYWGTLLDPSTGDLIAENVVWRVANRRYLISPPKPNPLWHQQSPFVVGSLLRTPHAVWHKALMDAPTRHNLALNELYNLILDAGMMATHGIKQLRTDWLEDESQVADGISPGTTLAVSSQCPPNAKVLERVDTSAMSAESVKVYEMTIGEFQQSALTNDLRLGVLPSRQVKATEVVEMSQAITSVFSGVSKVVEVDFLQVLLDKIWLTEAQHLQSFDEDELKNLFGEARGAEIAAMKAAEVFQATVQGHKFKVYGISATLNKMKDFRKIQALLQTIGTSEVLIESFLEKYSFKKLLGEIMKSLDLDVSKLELDEEEAAMNAMAKMMGQGGGAGQSGGQQPGSTPDRQSNINKEAQTAPLNESVQSAIPQPHFPPQATSAAHRG